jgi:hypothetical protein
MSAARSVCAASIHRNTWRAEAATAERLRDVPREAYEAILGPDEPQE